MHFDVCANCMASSGYLFFSRGFIVASVVSSHLLRILLLPRTSIPDVNLTYLHSKCAPNRSTHIKEWPLSSRPVLSLVPLSVTYFTYRAIIGRPYAVLPPVECVSLSQAFWSRPICQRCTFVYLAFNGCVFFRDDF